MAEVTSDSVRARGSLAQDGGGAAGFGVRQTNDFHLALNLRVLSRPVSLQEARPFQSTFVAVCLDVYDIPKLLIT